MPLLSRREPDTPLSRIAEHVRDVVDLVGVGHVALGSEFGGTMMPDGVCTARGLPALIDTPGADG